MATNGHSEPINSDVNPEALKQGYEPDKVNIRVILAVPLVLVICFLITFWIVREIIWNTRVNESAAVDNSLTAERGSKPINVRLSRISSEEGAKPEYKQPRLEALNELEPPSGKDNGNAVLPFVESYQPTKMGNSPHYHPEDMRPTSALGKKLGLQDFKRLGEDDLKKYGWWPEKKDAEIVRLPVADAMKVVLEAKDSAGKPYLKQNSRKLSDLQQQGPKASNSQWNVSPSKTPEESPPQSPSK